MAHYIDAERLREEIKSIEEDARKVRVAEESTMNQKIGADGQVHLCQKLNLLIDSLQKEQPEEPKIEIAEYYYQKGVFEGLSQGRADALKILEEFMKRKADPVIVIKQQEQPEVDLEKPVPADLEEKSEKPTISDKELLAKEISRFLSNAKKMGKGEWRGKYPISEFGFGVVAQHFYEMGLNARRK